MARLHLIRHGQTEWNQNARLQGQRDIQLSERGLNEVILLGRCLSRESLDVVYSSDLGRALATAREVAEPHGLTPLTCADLRELNFGCWEGMNYSEIQAQYAEQWDAWKRSGGTLAVHGGERVSQLQDRACQAVYRIAKEHPEGNVAVVTHGGSIKVVLCAVLGIELRKMDQIRIDNASITTIDFFDGYPIIQRLNDCHHLNPDC